jgi:hypothetical protein
MPKPLVAEPRKRALRSALLLAGSLMALGACATPPQQPGAGQMETPSSSQAADGPQTAAWGRSG